MNSLEVRQARDTATGVEIIGPRGEIDVSNVEVLDRVLEELLRERPRRLLVDLDGLDYLDSAGVSSLLRSGQAIARAGGQLSLVGGKPFVQRLLRMTGIDRLFGHFQTIAAALEAEAPGANRVGGAAPAGDSAPAPADDALRPMLSIEG